MHDHASRSWTVLLGRGFLALAAIMSIVAVWTLVSRTQMRRTWPIAEGVIIDAQLTVQRGSKGGILCGSQYKVRYTANGQMFETEHRSASHSSNCAAWEREVAEMQGSRIEMLYDPANPETAYPGGGKTIGFFLAPIISGGLATAFFIAGGLVLVLTK